MIVGFYGNMFEGIIKRGRRYEAFRGYYVYVNY